MCPTLNNEYRIPWPIKNDKQITKNDLFSWFYSGKNGFYPDNNSSITVM